MSLFGLLRVEFRRGWLAHLALALSALVVGLSVAGALRVQARLASMLRPPAWGATVALLPKGMTLDDLREDLASGRSRAFLPKVLFESLQTEVMEEQRRHGLLNPSLEFFAVRPSSGGLMKLGTVPVDESPWKGLTVIDWQASADAHTPEWGDQVVEAIFARGSLEAARYLKTLADRRTVAQGILVADEIEADRAKAETLLGQVWVAVGLVVVCGLLTLLLNARLIGQQRRNLFEALEILGTAGSGRGVFTLLQWSLYLLLPAVVGAGAAFLTF